MTSADEPPAWTRVYSLGFGALLVVATVVLAVLAVTGDPSQRRGFGGLAIVVGAMAAGAMALLVALERRRRGSARP